MFSRDDVIRIHSLYLEQSRDEQLVNRLAETVLEKSRWIDHAASYTIPGMHRTRTEQMQRIQELVEENNNLHERLQSLYKVAQNKRTACRHFVRTNTSKALDILEEGIGEGGAGNIHLSTKASSDHVMVKQEDDDKDISNSNAIVKQESLQKMDTAS